MISNQVSDTVWEGKQYGMDNILLSAGTYKDKDLTVPNGHFIYYGFVFSSSLPPGTKIKEIAPGVVQYIKTTGDFNNGMKNGQWIEYAGDGSKITLNTYKNDYQNGLYESYNSESQTVLFRGNYINDKREGEWFMLGASGNIITTYIYKDGKVIKTVEGKPIYKGPSPTKDFKVYISNNLNRISRPDTYANLTVICAINTEGKLITPVITGSGLTAKLNDKLIEIISKAPAWNPLYDPATKQNLEGLATFTITIAKWSVDVKY